MVATASEDATARGSGAREGSKMVAAIGQSDAEPAAADKTVAESASADEVVPFASPATGTPQPPPEPAMKGTDGGSALDLIVHDDSSGREWRAASVAMSSGASWCSIDQLERDWASEVTSKPSSASGDQGTLVPSNAAPIVLVTTHRLFTDYQNQLAAFSKDVMARLYQVEKSVMGVNEKHTALFQKTLSAYHMGKSQCQAVKAELARVREQLAKAQAVDSAEFERLKEQLAKAQEIDAEVPVLKEKLKNFVPVAQLAAKLSGHDAEHEQGTKDLWEGIRRLHEEVNELRAAEEQLKISHQAELNRRGECHRKKSAG
ncbi:hypothetical protein ACQ4PT_071252 [Festuca glaucescens]